MFPHVGTSQLGPGAMCTSRPTPPSPEARNRHQANDDDVIAIQIHISYPLEDEYIIHNIYIFKYIYIYIYIKYIKYVYIYIYYYDC